MPKSSSRWCDVEDEEESIAEELGPSGAESGARPPLGPAVQQEGLPAEVEAALVAAALQPGWWGKHAAIQGYVWELSCTKDGARFIQELLDEAEDEGCVDIVQELKGHVNESWQSFAAQHANYVVQKCIVVLPANRYAFICEELYECINEAARNKFGCRIVQRLMEHCNIEQLEQLFSRLLAPEKIMGHIHSKFGNYVIQHVLEHAALRKWKSEVVQALLSDTEGLRLASQNRFGSHVVQKAMQFASDEERMQLLKTIGAVQASNRRFQKSMHGSYVTKEAARALAQTW